MTASTTLNGIARQLVNQGLVTNETATDALSVAKSKKLPFLTSLASYNDVDATSIAQYISADFGLPLFDLDTLQSESVPSEYLNEDLITSQNAVPIAKRGSRLFIAISDPTNNEPLDKYKFASGLSVEAVIVEEPKLAELRNRFQDGNGALAEGLDESFDLEVDNPEGNDEELDESGVDETPVVRFHK